MTSKTDEMLRVADVDELLDRGLRADEEQNLDLAERIVDEAGSRLGENHPRVLHLAGRVAWAHGDVERALGFFQQATDQSPGRAEIHIDCARCLLLMGEADDQAEEQVRIALDLPDIDALQEGDAKVLLSRVRLDDDDAEEALEVLESIPQALKTHALYLSALADVYIELDRGDEAVAAIEGALAAEPDDPDLHYQLGLVRQSGGDLEGGATAMLRVLELEAALRGKTSDPTTAEITELCSRMEQAIAELPDPLMAYVANAPINVVRHASADEVREGADPRAGVYFTGTPKLEDSDAALRSIVIARDVLLDEVDDDDELDEALLIGLVSELADFFDRQDILFSEVEQ